LCWKEAFVVPTPKFFESIKFDANNFGEESRFLKKEKKKSIAKAKQKNSHQKS